MNQSFLVKYKWTLLFFLFFLLLTIQNLFGVDWDGYVRAFRVVNGHNIFKDAIMWNIRTGEILGDILVFIDPFFTLLRIFCLVIVFSSSFLFMSIITKNKKVKEWDAYDGLLFFMTPLVIILLYSQFDPDFYFKTALNITNATIPLFFLLALWVQISKYMNLGGFSFSQSRLNPLIFFGTSLLAGMGQESISSVFVIVFWILCFFSQTILKQETFITRRLKWGALFFTIGFILILLPDFLGTRMQTTLTYYTEVAQFVKRNLFEKIFDFKRLFLMLQDFYFALKPPLMLLYGLFLIGIFFNIQNLKKQKTTKVFLIKEYGVILGIHVFIVFTFVSYLLSPVRIGNYYSEQHLLFPQQFIFVGSVISFNLNALRNQKNRFWSFLLIGTCFLFLFWSFLMAFLRGVEVYDKTIQERQSIERKHCIEKGHMVSLPDRMKLYYPGIEFCSER